MAENAPNVGKSAQRRRRRDAEENRAALVRAGALLFAARGLDPTLDEIALKAGVGVGTAYRHFANKLELAEAVLAESIDQLIKETAAAAEADSGWDSLVAFIEASLSPQFKQRALHGLLKADYASVHVEMVHQHIETTIDRILDRGHRDGTIRLEVTSTDIGLISMSLGNLAELYSDVSPDIWRRFVPAFVDAFRAGSETALPQAPLTREEFIIGLVRRERA